MIKSHVYFHEIVLYVTSRYILALSEYTKGEVHTRHYDIHMLVKVRAGTLCWCNIKDSHLFTRCTMRFVYNNYPFYIFQNAKTIFMTTVLNNVDIVKTMMFVIRSLDSVQTDVNLGTRQIHAWRVTHYILFYIHLFLRECTFSVITYLMYTNHVHIIRPNSGL